MKRRALVVLSLCALAIIAYFTASKWLIRHQTLTFNDILRGDREVTVDIAVRRDREMEAMAELIELPVAILSHGNTVKHTEYSFIATRLPPAAISSSASSTTSAPTIRWSQNQARNMPAAGRSIIAASSTSCS